MLMHFLLIVTTYLPFYSIFSYVDIENITRSNDTVYPININFYDWNLVGISYADHPNIFLTVINEDLKMKKWWNQVVVNNVIIIIIGSLTNFSILYAETEEYLVHALSTLKLPGWKSWLKGFPTLSLTKMAKKVLEKLK